MDECLEILGNAVRRARKQMKLSQEKLAELLDVDYKTINFIENHKGNPTFEIVYQLIRVLKLDAVRYSITIKSVKLLRPIISSSF